jgi:hypothetical protein
MSRQVVEVHYVSMTELSAARITCQFKLLHAVAEAYVWD